MCSLAFFAAAGCFCSLTHTASALSQTRVLRHHGDASQRHLVDALRAHHHQASHTLVEVSVTSLQETPVGDSVRVRPDRMAVLEATRAVGIGPQNDGLRLASLGKVAQVIVQDDSDSTVLCEVPGGVGKVWFPLGALLRKQEQPFTPASLAEHGDNQAANRTANGTAASGWSQWPQQSNGEPLYPLEPMMDVDYIYNDDDGGANYLEDYENTSQMINNILTSFGYQQKNVTAALRELPTPATELETVTVAPTTTTEATTTTTSVEPTPATVAATTTTRPPTSAPTPAPTKQALALLVACTTHLDPRQDRPLSFILSSQPAAFGAQCMFGVDARDEGSHCIYDNAKYGSFGWCYTKEDKGEWGSCDQSCPLWGAAKKLEGRIDLLTQKVHIALARVNGK